MKRMLATAGALLALAMTASAATAASLPVYGQLAGAELESGLIEVHGLHRSCEPGRRGWHRSLPWGRLECRPHFRNFGFYGYGYGNGHHRRHDHHDDRGRGRGGSHDGEGRGGRGGDHDGGGRRSSFEGSSVTVKSYDL